MKTTKFISVVYPTYNEEGIIREVVKDTADVLSNMNNKWEILVVNDGSTDRTTQILEQLSAENSNIVTINHEQNKGYASAAKTGMKMAKGEVVIIIDSDGQQDPNDIPCFIAKMDEGYDIVVGWKKDRKDSLLRIFLSKVYNWIFRFLFSLKLHDVDCGFRALKREVAQKIDIKDGSIIVGTQMFVHIKKLDLNIVEIPVRHYPRKTGDTIFKLWKLPWMVSSILIELFRLKIEYMKEVKYAKRS